MIELTFRGEASVVLAEMREFLEGRAFLDDVKDALTPQAVAFSRAVATDVKVMTPSEIKAEKDFQKDFGTGLDKVIADKLDGKEPMDDPLPDSMLPATKKVNRRKPVKGKPKAGPGVKAKDTVYVPLNETGISDNDISKAASEVGAKTSPDAVKDIMKELKAVGKNLHELEQDQRENFLTLAAAAMENAK